MHPVWSGQILTEPDYILIFSFVRISPSAFELFKSGDDCNINDDRVYGSKPHDPYAFQQTVVERVVDLKIENRTYRCFRRDIRLPNGDFVMARAKLLEYPKVIQDITPDVKNIYKILDSIEPIKK